MGKRKHMDSTDRQNDTNSTETTNQKNNIHTPHPMISNDNQKNSPEELDGKKEEESTSFLNPIMGDTKGFDYNIESPPIMAINSSTFVFDDEPLITYMDSFALFEAFGYTAGEENYAELGMQSILP